MGCLSNLDGVKIKHLANTDYARIKLKSNLKQLDEWAERIKMSFNREKYKLFQRIRKNIVCIYRMSKGKGMFSTDFEKILM